MPGDERRPVILLAFANDRVGRARYLRNVAKELRRVRERLEKAEAAGLCQLVIRPNTTVAELLDAGERTDQVSRWHCTATRGWW